ncbi:hypothetical protein AGOR_G00192340 [Albula goreensis]|uniref:Smr domain-containing protein n=1 Tax=Albula goreensis TaxID=1534307 RepID=A0A8T3CYD3_9TELE|nr:hypothetical protein AGOR_G00192340 [Albula goreensis]
MALPPLETTQTNVFTPERGAEQQSRGLEDQDSPSIVTKDQGSAGQKAESPGGGGGVEAVTLVGSQERRLRQNRRSGKQCKLALTFTNNSPTSPRPLLESPQAPARPIPITPETPTLLCTGRSVQTDPQDFALLWRLDHQQQADVSVVCPNVVVLSVKNNFQSEPASMKESPGHQEVPYRVVHDKGTQVEEQELESGSSSKFKDLQILSQHFKLVNFDTLEDLYDKCHEDIQWTTNLLLDSGEELFRYDGNDDSQDDVEQAAKEHLIQGRDIDSNENLTNVHVNWGACGGRGVEQLAAVCSPESEGVGGEAGSGEAEKFPDLKETSALGGSELGAQCSSGTCEQEPAPKLAQEAEEDSLKDLPEPEELSIGQPNEETDTSQQVLDSGETKPAGELESGSAGQIDRPQDLDTDQPLPTMPALGDYGGLIRELESREEPNNPMSVDEVTQSLLFQLGEMNKRDKEAEQREREMERASQAKLDRTPLNIQSLELKIPPELALQLSELFGPVGIDPGSLTPEDCSVQIDLNLARLLHQKWKDTIQERQRQEALSYHLLQESSVHWGESQTPKGTSRDGAWGPHFLIGTDGFASLGQSEVADSFPFMDHWNVPQSHVSLRDIMLEEQVLQEHKEKSRESRTDSRKDGAALLKEQQLYSTFPSIDRHFLNDIFKDHNYSLEQTTQFLRSLLDEGPVKTVVAQDVAPPRDTQRAASSERRRKGKEVVTKPEFQDTEDPEYEDFRTEAMLQRRKQQECFSKAAEAYRQGMKDVASFYAQQGHLHGQKMKEANDRAAMQIFERVNATLLPQNILDLHGLHVDEALYHLKRVLEDKTAEWQQGGCRPKLSVITGKGNHSQGGVARIRPAVIDYLTSHDYMFTEPKCGLLLVTLH